MIRNFNFYDIADNLFLLINKIDEDHWNVAVEPDINVLYRLSQITRDQIGLSSASEFDHSSENPIKIPETVTDRFVSSIKYLIYYFTDFCTHVI